MANRVVPGASCATRIHFEEGQLAGTRLVGFSLSRSPEGDPDEYRKVQAAA